MDDTRKDKFLFKLIFLVLIFTFCMPIVVQAQYKFRFNSDDWTSMYFKNNKSNGFAVNISLVAMFTTGVADRSGIRLGTGLTLSQTFGDWTFSAGLDTYKAKQDFGLGTSFGGVSYNDNRYGFSYYCTKYYQGDQQLSGIVSVELDEFRINFEDDILALPFTGFVIYDRYRTAALEFQYKGFLFGTNVYTTDINGVTDASLYNSRGTYMNGVQVSSPLYIGYTDRNLVLRYGVNRKIGGLVGQNGWHRLFFNTPDFKAGDYKDQFFQIGVNKPYTLY